MAPDDDKNRTPVTITSGTMVSHYRIIEMIGAGGMGEVYLAEDTGLNRRVALKFLPTDLCRDDDCRARFTREAQAAAKLNHPNIITIHEVNEYIGRPFFAMEYLEGLPLDEHVKDRKLSWQEMIGLAIQIVEGLGEAHHAGIIHRDIKPSNILVDNKGRAKILDFGLAAIKGVDRLTKTGSTLGTLPYMSPEQTRGEVLDERSDIFSFGVVVYEMISGHLPFGGEHEAAIIYSIGYEEPEPLARYKSGVSQKLQGIVSKALAKDKNIRYRHMDEMLADLLREQDELLRDVRGERSATAIESKVHPKSYAWRSSLWVALSVLITGAVITGYLVISRLPSAKAPVSRMQLTFVGNAESPALSPDGRTVAFIARSKAGVADALQVQEVSGATARTIFEAPEIDALSWSPDGSEILAAVTTESGERLVLTDRLGSNLRYYPIRGLSVDWSPDGSRFVVTWPTERRIVIVEKVSGRITSVPTDFDDKPVLDVAWSPSGSRLAVCTWHVGKDVGTLWTCSVNGENAEKVIDSTSFGGLTWSPKGDALYLLSGRRTGSLIKVPVSPKTGKRAGDTRVLMSGLQVFGFTISADGRTLALWQDIGWSNLWRVRVDEHGAPKSAPLALTTGTSDVRSPAISPDGSQVAYIRNTPDEDLHVFTVAIDGGDAYQVTHTGTESWFPAWSPDGSKIAYSSWNDTGRSTISVIDAQGGLPKVLTKCDGRSLLTWAPGPNILYSEIMNPVLHAVDPETGIVTSPALPKSTRREMPARYAPDGLHYAAISSPRSDASSASHDQIRELNIMAVGGDSIGKTWRLSPNASRCLGWSADGRWVYFTMGVDSGIEISRVSVADGREEKVTWLPQPDVTSVAMGPDCRTFVYVLSDSKSDIWLMKDFDPHSR